MSSTKDAIDKNAASLAKRPQVSPFHSSRTATTTTATEPESSLSSSTATSIRQDNNHHTNNHHQQSYYLGPYDSSDSEHDIDNDMNDNDDERFVDTLGPFDYTLFGPVDTTTIGYRDVCQFLQKHAAAYTHVPTDRRLDLVAALVQDELSHIRFVEQVTSEQPAVADEQQQQSSEQPSTAHHATPRRRYRVLTDQRSIHYKLHHELQNRISRKMKNHVNHAAAGKKDDNDHDDAADAKKRDEHKAVTDTTEKNCSSSTTSSTTTTDDDQLVFIHQLLPTDVVAGNRHAHHPGNVRYKDYLANFIKVFPEPTWENAKRAYEGFDGRFVEQVVVSSKKKKDTSTSATSVFRPLKTAKIHMKIYHALRNFQNKGGGATKSSAQGSGDSTTTKKTQGTASSVSDKNSNNSEKKKGLAVSSTTKPVHSTKPAAPTKEKVPTIERPEPNDVVFGKRMPRHPGNIQFAALVQQALPKYQGLARTSDSDAFCARLLQDFSNRFVVFQSPSSYKVLVTTQERVRKVACILSEEVFEPGSFLRPYKKQLPNRKSVTDDQKTVGTNPCSNKQPLPSDQSSKRRQEAITAAEAQPQPSTPTEAAGSALPNSALRTSKTNNKAQTKIRKPVTDVKVSSPKKKRKTTGASSTSARRQKSPRVSKKKAPSHIPAVQPDRIASMSPSMRAILDKRQDRIHKSLAGFLRAIGQNHKHLPFVEKCLTLLLDVVSFDDRCRQETCRHGGVAIVVNVMQLHEQHKRIQLLSLRILLNLMSGSANEGENVAVMLEEEGGDMIARRLQTIYGLQNKRGNRDIILLRHQVLEKMHGLLKERETRMLISPEPGAGSW